MRLTQYRFCLPWIVLAGLLFSGCSGDDPATTKDAAADKAPLSDVGLTEGGAVDAPAPEAAIPDIWDGDASMADTGPAPDLGPPPGFPPNLTMMINMGDSVAVGYGSSSGHSYKELLIKNDDTAYPAYKGLDLTTKFSGIKLVGKAAIGALSNDLVTQAKSLPGNPKGDTLVIISIGGNDFSAGLINIVMNPSATKTLGTQVAANLKQVMTHFSDKKLYPGKVMVLLFLVHDPTDAMGNIPAISGLVGFCTMIQTLGAFVGPAVVKQLGVFNGYLKTFAQANNVLIVDNASHFLGHGYHYNNAKSKHYKSKDPTLWFYNDCLHLNDKGNNELRKIIWKRITGK